MGKKIFAIADAKMRNPILSCFRRHIYRGNQRFFQSTCSNSTAPSVVSFSGVKCKRCAERQTCHSWSKIMTARTYLQGKDLHIIQYNAKRNFSTTCIKLEKENEKKDEEKDDKKSDERDPKKENQGKGDKNQDVFELGYLDGASDSLLAFLIVGLCAYCLFAVDDPEDQFSYSGEIPWTEFLDLMKQGKVRKIVNLERAVRVYLNESYSGEHINIPSGCWAKLHTDMPFSSFASYVRNLEKQNKTPNRVILNEGIKTTSVLFLVFLVAYSAVIIRRMTILSQMQKNMRQHIKPNAKPTVNAEQKMDNNNFLNFMMVEEENVPVDDKPKFKFKDIAGMKEAKIEVMEFVDYLKNPLRYQRLGAKIPHGALLLGPPGCGKTLLAKAVAAEADVPFFSKAGSEFVEIYGGQGASRVRELFKMARAKAPCIIFIDELDAVGRSRSGMGAISNTEEEQTLNQLLVEMDGINTTEGVIMLGATNRVDILDKALLRPGRFDRHILIDLPTAQERVELFEMYLAKIKTDFSISEYAPRLAQLTPGMSGADIANVCNEAAIYAGTNNENTVSRKDMDYALQKIIGGTEKRSYVRDAHEKKINAYYEAGRAVVSWMTKTSDAILKISIVPRSKYRLGHYQYYKPERDLQTNVELFEKMCVHLAGSTAEALIFNHHSSAAEKDLDIVKKLAYLQVREFGMNDSVGQISFHFEEGDETMPKPYSQYMENLIDREVRALVSKASLQSKKILEENMDKVHKVAKELMERETLSYEDIEKLIGPPPHGNKMPEEYMNLNVPSSETPTPQTI
ncbi:paraplegin-like isoform X2 [Saccostrea echinata]|uniref:paraplegin-like isoform X2 n=1 Tax=Saccostrea echinata TaxID=191078 RepID=UPI002A80EA24|nr:paraplegin-like isoform X2 [Saccostrea echinata]